MKIEFVFFDLDGVLVDACEWHYEALNIALQKTLGFTISRADHVEKYNGLPTRVKLNLLGIDKDKAVIIEEIKQRETLSLIEKYAKFDNVKIELLDYLKKSEVKVACVTNSIRDSAMLMLERTGQISYFDLIVTNEDVKENKPSPDCYNYAIKRLNANPEYSLCVEDSEKGKQAARSSLTAHLWAVDNSSCVTLENYMRLFV